jgi:hypothetical protein
MSVPTSAKWRLFPEASCCPPVAISDHGRPLGQDMVERRLTAQFTRGSARRTGEFISAAWNLPASTPGRRQRVRPNWAGPITGSAPCPPPSFVRLCPAMTCSHHLAPLVLPFRTTGWRMLWLLWCD